MKRWQIGSFGEDTLELKEAEPKACGPGEVRLEMRACSLNYRDLLVTRGIYNPRLELPLVPCSDGVGVVREVGEGVSQDLLGQRVAGCFAPLWLDGSPTRTMLRQTLGAPLTGTLQEDIVLSANGVVPVPSHLSDAEAATLPCAALTAWSALEAGRVSEGSSVLVQGTGGVSLFALQLAKLRGASVLVTSSNDDKLKRAEALGADHLINYKREPEWGKVAKGLLPSGFDVVVEVGGAGTLAQSVKAVSPGGSIALIGILSGAKAPVNLLPVVMNAVRMQGIMVGHRAGFEAMNAAIDESSLQPVVDRVFEFEQAPEAFAHLASAKHFGKVCIQISARTSPQGR